MKIKFKILLPLILFCTVFLQQINAQEGSGNWKGTQTGRQTSLYVPSFTTGNTGYNTRGFMMLPSTRSDQNAYNNAYDPGHRFYVYVKQGETVYFAFRHASGSARSFQWYYDNRSSAIGDKFPSTTSTGRTTISTTGYSSTNSNLTQTQTVEGPRPLAGGSSGYPISNNNGGSFTNNTGGDRAFWLEFDSSSGFEITDWDVTVANSSNVHQPGRVYCKYWSMLNGLPGSGSNTNPNNSSFHDNFTFFVPIDNTETPADDYLVKSLNFGGSNAGYVVFFANDTGPRNTGDPIEDRKSITGTSNLYHFPLFVADPDESLWPNSSISAPIVSVIFVRTGTNSAEGHITIDVDYPATIDILIDLNGNGIYDGNDVLISEYFPAAGQYTVIWDGKDGNGDNVPSGTTVEFSSSLNFFPVHFPVYDMEQSAGMSFRNVRPGAPDIQELYWDHSNLSSGTNPSDSWSVFTGQSLVNTTGMKSPDENNNKWNRWYGTTDNGFGNNRTINTWTGAYSYYSIQTVVYNYDDSDLEVLKTVDNLNPNVGDVVEYSILLKNNGISWNYNVEVEDMLPSGLQYVSHTIENDSNNTGSYNSTYNPSTGSWTIVTGSGEPNRLLAGDKLTLKIKAKVLPTGDYENIAVIIGADENDPNTSNNSSSVILDVECSTENVFSEDFGISDKNNGNMGRIPSPYMPSGSYEFGDSYLMLPTPGGNPWDDNPIRNAARINDGFYAVVAPEFINDGWFPDDGWGTWWPNNVSDHTGNDVNSTNKGAVMVVNAGEVLAPFYERTVNLDKDEFYKLSFWIYLVKGPTRVALDIIDPITGETLGTIETGVMLADDPTYEGKWTEHVLYLKTGDCTIDELIVSLRNDYQTIDGNDYFIDDVSMVKWACEVDEDYFVEIKCPSTPLATADINQIPQGHTATGNVLDNDEGNGLTVTGATYLDSNGDEQPLLIGQPTPVYGSNGELAGTMTLNADGTYTFESDPDFSGEVPVTYEITDENGNTDTAVLSIEVIPAVNPGSNNPPIAQNDTAFTPEGTPVTSNVLANDSDPDGDGLTVTGATSTDDNGNPITIPVGTSTTVYGTDENGNPVVAGTIELNADGSYTFTPAPGFTGTVNPITYTISDGNGGSDTATLFIEVLPDDGKNHTFANDDANSAPKGETMNGNVLDNDTDPEGNGQTVTNVTIDGVDYPITPGTPAVINIPGKGELTIDENGNYTFVPEPNFVGTVVVGVTVCDDGTPESACDTSNLYLTSLDTMNCYKPANLIANGGLTTEIGISALRLENTDGWPQVREGAWIALESKTKGFVPNRLSNAQISAIPAANLVIGMMVYNTDEDCLQINVDGTEDGWKCFGVQSCD